MRKLPNVVAFLTVVILLIALIPPVSGEKRQADWHVDLEVGYGAIKDIAWNSANGLIAVASNRGIQLYTADFLLQTSLDTGLVGEVDWSHDGALLASSGEDGIRIWDAEHMDTGVTDLVLTPNQGSLSWHPNRNVLAYGDEDGNIHVWDVIHDSFDNPVESLHSFTAPNCQVQAIAWNPDGTQLAVVGCDGIIRLWTSETNQIDTIPGPWSSFPYPPIIAWRPDGEQFIVTAYGTTPTGFVVCDVANREYYEPDVFESQVQAAVWSPDGTLLATLLSNQVLQLRDQTTFTVIDEIRPFDALNLSERVYESGLALDVEIRGRLVWIVEGDFLLSSTIATLQLWRVNGQELELYQRAPGYNA